MRYAVLSVITLFVFSCKQNTADDKQPIATDTVKADPSLQEIIDKESTEAGYEKTEATGVKKVVNERFNFSFEIPSAWKAIDKSNNGDGFFLESDNSTADIRIYGENLEGNEIMAEMEIKSCTRTETFKFRDGYPGLKCYQAQDEYYYYDTPTTRIVLYVHADAVWKTKNIAVIRSIAESITSGRGNFN